MIKITNLNKVYKSGSTSVKAISDISFRIEDNEFIAITGPSGSGKSTLVQMIGDIETPTSII